MTESFQALHDCALNFGIDRDQSAGVAVSGGSDSLAMLHLLHEHGWSLEAATVDHGLRAEAAGEAAYVAEVCAVLGVHHSVLTVDLSGMGGNLQNNARRARYAALREWARVRGLEYVAIGHTMDDQAETFLMRVARGSGLDGLSGMRGWKAEGELTWLRPFLTCRRHDLRDYLKQRGIRWVDDPSNEDEGFERVRMRNALAVLEPLGLTPEKIWEVCFHLRDVGLELDLRAEAAFKESCHEIAGDLIFPNESISLSGLGHETRRRMLVAGLMWVSGADYPPRRTAVSSLYVGVTKSETHTLHGCVITSGDEVRITREFNAVKHLATPTTALWDGRWQLEGPHAPDLEIRPLGEAVKDTPWRETGMPRQSLLASPAIWRGETLVAAPVAGLSEGWTAKATGRGKFTDFLISR